jgi:Holliday junction resolvasome RuvABC DNA-binding subunit
VLELKDRLRDVAPADAGTEEQRPSTDRLRDDLVSALENLGYHRPLAEKAADAARARDGGAMFEDALKSALRELMR